MIEVQIRNLFTVEELVLIFKCLLFFSLMVDVLLTNTQQSILISIYTRYKMGIHTSHQPDGSPLEFLKIKNTS